MSHDADPQPEHDSVQAPDSVDTLALDFAPDYPSTPPFIGRAPFADDIEEAIQQTAPGVSDGQYSISKSASPIFPENALQLHLDSPGPSSFEDATSLTSASPSMRGLSPGPHVTLDSPPRADPRVRFRSRVRIASGIHRERRASSGSSSITAPLRFAAEDAGARAGYAKRLLAMTVAAQTRREERERDGKPATPAPRRRGFDERDPLVGPRRGYESGCAVEEDEDEDEDEEAEEAYGVERRRRKSEEDVVFGHWPWRLVNYRWWWWKVEPVACWCCADDSDDDD